MKEDIRDWLNITIKKNLKYFDAEKVTLKFISSPFYKEEMPFKKMKEEVLKFIAWNVRRNGDEWYLV